MVKLRSLEMLRTVAALLVVLYHAQFVFRPLSSYPMFGNMFDSGFRGVDLFFVLSGFIILYVHGDDLDKPYRLSNYTFKRITRVYPAVFIMTALTVVMYFMGGARPTLMAVTASALLLPQQDFPLLVVTWTLTYETFFYAVFAVMIVNFRAGMVMLLLWQASTAVNTVIGADLGLAGYYFRPVSLDFGVGLACAWWLRRSNSDTHPMVWCGVLAAGMAGFVGGLAMNAVLPCAGALCALGTGAAILALVRLEQAGRLRIPSLFVLLGNASYSIYMVHFSVVSGLAAVLAQREVPVSNAVCLTCAAIGVGSGLAFDHLVDQPLQLWLHEKRKVYMARGFSRKADAGAISG